MTLFTVRKPSTPRRRSAAVALAAVAALAAGTAVGPASAKSATKTAAPKITGLWARTSPSGTTMGAAYAKLNSKAGDRLLSATVAKTIATTVEIHETVPAPATTKAATAGSASSAGSAGSASTMAGMSGSAAMSHDHGDSGMTEGEMAGMGAMVMRPIKALELPAGKTVELKPGGYHVMLIGLAKPLKTGQTFKLTLRFEKAGNVVVNVPVRENAP